MDNKKNMTGILEIIKHYGHIDSNLIKNFNRSIPFQDSVFDREERAKKLKFGEKCYLKFPSNKIIFANGGDRSLEEIPETKVMKKYNIKMVDGLGDKIRSSSDLTGIGK